MKVLVIAAHPDDETLGCAGTLLKHKLKGDELHWLIATRATTPTWPAKTVRAKAMEIQRVAKTYGMKSVKQLQFASTTLDAVPQNKLIAAIRETIERVRPEIVYVVHGGDVHSDHKAVFNATFTVLKPFYMKKLNVRRVLCYETFSSTDAAPALVSNAFFPTVYSDISAFINKKLSVMAEYITEVQNEPMPRASSSLRALARVRGATIAADYAEAFMLVRELI